MKITIQNDFHRTEVTLRVGPNGRVNCRQMARAKRVLCGITDCRCGWNRVIDGEGNRMDEEYEPDGGMTFLRH